MKNVDKLIRKYNTPGPRYTSYPALPYWSGPPSEELWIEHLRETRSTPEVDLYVHVPFCESLCYYCGCHRTITKSHEGEVDFINLIKKEWDLYRSKYHFNPKINSLHFGGGTPTFLAPKNLDFLIKYLTQNRSDSFIGSIEIDPRTCKSEHINVLRDNNLTRVSLGIQDFDPSVQKIINRFQSKEMIDDLVIKLRKEKIGSINFDLIYGLPGQTLDSIKKTINEVIKIKPDLISFFSYAHLPDKIKNQRLIPESTLPSPELKRELYEVGKEKLIQNGYLEVGLDHFSLPENYLAVAKKNGELHRNFMGHVEKKTEVLIGLGPSSISDSSKSYIQNIKDLKKYKIELDKGVLPIEKGHVLSQDDKLVQKIIQDILCKGIANIKNKPQKHLKLIQDELLQFSNDGIIELFDEDIKMTELGKPFIRNVAMCFDLHLRDESKKVKFSQTI